MSADLRGALTLRGGRGERKKEAVTVTRIRAEDVSSGRTQASFHRRVKTWALKGVTVKVWNLRPGATYLTSSPHFPP